MSFFHSKSLFKKCKMVAFCLDNKSIQKKQYLWTELNLTKVELKRSFNICMKIACVCCPIPVSHSIHTPNDTRHATPHLTLPTPPVVVTFFAVKNNIIYIFSPLIFTCIHTIHITDTNTIPYFVYNCSDVCSNSQPDILS